LAAGAVGKQFPAVFVDVFVMAVADQGEVVDI
jgi:hypothetical protein